MPNNQKTIQIILGSGNRCISLQNDGSDVFSIEKIIENLCKLFRTEDDDINNQLRFLYKGIIIKHNKTEPTYTKTSLFLCEKRRFFMGRTEKGGKVF